MCGQPIRLTEKQAEKLECKGIHWLEVDGHEVAIHDKGLRVGTRTIMREVEYGFLVQVGDYCSLYKCRIGNRTKIEDYVKIQEDVVIGHQCNIGSFVFVGMGTRLGNNVSIGPGAFLVTDGNPRAAGKWKTYPVRVENDVSIGAGAIVRPGTTLHQGCIINAGEVV